MRRRLTLRDIHPSTQFEEIVRYESARADRAGTGFALVSLAVGGLLSRRRELRRLIRALRQRVRATDVVGWQDAQTLSILLPGTDRKGGESFAVNFVRQHFDKRSPPPFTVRCHPDGWGGGGAGSTVGGRGSIAANSGKRSAPGGKGASKASPGNNNGGNGSGAGAFKRVQE